MARYQKAPDIVIPPSQPAVKSIQNGSFSGQLAGNSQSTNPLLHGMRITIATVDPAKCFVSVSGSGSTNSGNSGHYTNQSTTQTIVVGIVENSTTLWLRTARSAAGSTASEGSWTVVEYA